MTERAARWDIPTQLHARGTVRITDACTACGACLATCPERALRRAPRLPMVVDDLCTACWDCVGICPAGAIFEVAR
jgi:NAD-dependent dihydropyrimidine dehydrogenase PreA subunit